MAETVGLNPLGVDGTQVSVLRQTRYASLVSCRTMTAELWKHRSVLSDFSHQTLEGQFVNQQFSGPLITTNLSQSHGTGPVTMGFLTVAGALLRVALITSFFSGLCVRWIYERFAWF